MKNSLNKEELVVPTADAADNSYAMDVIGNKTDAAAAGAVSATESVMAYAKQNVTNTETIVASVPRLVEITTPTALPQTAALTLFNVTGAIQIIELRAFVVQQVGAVANATKFVANANDICATLDLNAQAANEILSITGTFANPMIASAGGAIESQANNITVGAGTIAIECAGSDGGGGGNGLLTYFLVYRPVDSIGSVSAAI